MRLLKIFIFLGLLIKLSTINAQVSHININAQVKDTLNETVPAATVMLLNSKDSTLVNYTTTNSDGYFSFKNIKNTGYLLKISHISYMPLQINIPVSAEANVNLGTLRVEPIAEILMEVVIKSAQAPLFIKGDTVEYDARLFKIPPGSTVEDLLRRLPGIDVDLNGNISTQGKDVKRIYVDGKTFFGDDPKSVTKNLDAQAISKVQVYEDKSEQERMTGISDGNEEKVMNLELKDEFKKGHFGKVTIAGGTENRWAARGNFNSFNKTQQFSLIGYGNNINQSSVNWEDYSEFKGNAAFSGRDNGDFGFGNIGGYYMMIQGGFRSSNSDKYGFSNNYGGGVNYNYFKEKINFNASYFYNQTKHDSKIYTDRKTFLADTSFNMYDTTINNSFVNSHSLNSRLEYNIDSSNSIILKIDGRLSQNNSDNIKNQIFFSGTDIFINNNLNDNSNKYDSKDLSTLAIYKHDFNKVGRKFALSGFYALNQNDNKENIFNKNEFYTASTLTEQISILNSNSNNSNNLKSSALYVEPLSKKFSIMSFYNFRATNTSTEKIGEDALQDFAMVDSLSIFYNNKEIYNRLGTSLNYNWNGINLSLGGAYQIINLFNSYSTTESSPLLVPALSKSYYNFVPNFNANFQFPNKMRLNFRYSYSINAPSINYLQPIPNLSNRFFKTVGNPDLDPSKQHNSNVSWSYWNQSSFTSFSIGLSHTYSDSQIIYNQETKFVDDLGYTTIMKPENISGGQSASSYFWSSIPLIKTKLSLNLSGNYSYSNSPTYINTVKNTSINNSYSLSLGFDLNLGSKLQLSASSNGSLSDIKYSIQTSQNQDIMYLGAGLGVKWQFAKKSFFEANYDFTKYQNDRFELNEGLHLTNLSIRQVLGKTNKFELRLAAFDVFNQNKYILQQPGINYIETTKAPTLARYYMLSVSYNIKGFETKMKKDRW